jgi:uracil-DNA glycosylase
MKTASGHSPMTTRKLDRLLEDIRSCRICRDAPSGMRLGHEPRPVLRVSATARLAIVGQAPGARVHKSGIPFTDPSGVRLRQWMGVTDEEFYDGSRVAVIPMGFCFPGYNDKGADLPPRKECAPKWRDALMKTLPQFEVVLLVGGYAQAWHLDNRGLTLSDTVADWRAIISKPGIPRYWPLPHPSWRNNSWLKQRPWFDGELLPALRRDVRRVMED